MIRRFHRLRALSMHIMQILSGAGVNGAIIHCLLLTRELVRRGHRVTLVVRPDAWIARQLAAEPVSIVPSDLHRWPLDELRRVAEIVRSTDVDVVHTHMSSAHFFGVLLRCFVDVPCVATAHSRYFQLHWMLNDHVIANSEATRRFHRRVNLVRDRRIDVVRCFIDVARFEQVEPAARQRIRAEWSVADDETLVGTIGDLIRRKGQLYLVRALPEILRRVPRARVAIVGHDGLEPAYSRRVHAQAERLGVADRLIWAGHRGDIPQVMQALDLYVACPLEEALGLTALEAMAAGKPVIATHVGGLPECVVAERTGVLVPPADPAALAAAIVRLASDRALAAEFVAAGQKWVHQEFSPAGQTARVEEVLQKVVQRQRAA